VCLARSREHHKCITREKCRRNCFPYDIGVVKPRCISRNPNALAINPERPAPARRPSCREASPGKKTSIWCWSRVITEFVIISAICLHEMRVSRFASSFMVRYTPYFYITTYERVGLVELSYSCALREFLNLMQLITELSQVRHPWRDCLLKIQSPSSITVLIMSESEGSC